MRLLQSAFELGQIGFNLLPLVDGNLNPLRWKQPRNWLPIFSEDHAGKDQRYDGYAQEMAKAHGSHYSHRLASDNSFLKRLTSDFGETIHDATDCNHPADDRHD